LSVASGHPTLIYTPATRTWTTGASPPYVDGGIHHMQPVSLCDAIYIVGAFS